MIKNPLVSIVMPSFNTAEYIRASIESIINQTYQNFELIVVDDLSSDNSVEIINSFNDPRIKLIKNEKNSGAGVSRNTAIRLAKGDYMAFLDSDDLWENTKLEKQLDFMISNNYAFTYTNYIEIDENSDKTGTFITGPKKICKYGYYLFDWAGCLTVMYDIKKVGLIQIADIKKRNDYAFWLKITKNHKCYLLNETLGSYRRRIGSVSNVKTKQLIKSHYEMFRKSENFGVVSSSIFTFINMVFVTLKKIIYVKKA